jgi:hypothetical protein
LCEPTFRRDVSPPSSGKKNLGARKQLEEVVYLMCTYVSEERVASIFRVEKSGNEEPA